MAFWDKKKSKAAIDREQKEKLDLDRSHSQQMKDELNEIRMMPYKTEFPMEEINQFDSLLAQAAQSADRLSPAAFDVSEIDKEILGIIEVLRHAKEEGGSRETMKRCLTGIAYGLKHGHKEIPSHVNTDKAVERRVNQLKRYRTIVVMSSEIDKNYLEIARRTTEKNNRDELLKEQKEQLKILIEKNPSVYRRLKNLSPNDPKRLTGEFYEMDAAINAVVDRIREINQLSILIGNSKNDIEVLQTSVNSLVVQLENWERNIDEATTDQIEKLTKEFERYRHEQQKFMDQLRNSTSELNSAFDVLFDSPIAKEKMAMDMEEYDRIVREEELKQQEDAAGRVWLEQQEAERKQKLEKVKQENQTNQDQQILMN